MHVPFCTIIPPYLLRRLARQDAPRVLCRRQGCQGSPEPRAVVQSARTTAAPADSAGMRDVQPGLPHRSIYDADGCENLPGKIVRKEGEPADRGCLRR